MGGGSKRSRPKGQAAFRRILAALDGSEASGRALEAALKLAVLSTAELTIVHVGDRSPESERILEGARKAAQGRGARAEARLEPGEEVAETVLRVAEREGVDLVVVGHRGTSPDRGLLLGSVSHAVVQKSSRPVLVVP